MYKDQQPLGENPNATVNAKTDMSQDMAWNDELEKQYQSNKESSDSPEDYDVTLGDVAKGVGVGALGMVSGLGELSEQLTGYGEGLRDIAQSGSDYLVDSMTDDGKAALNADLVTEDKSGHLGLGKGAGDIDVWAMKFAQGIGSLAGGMLPGGAAGGITRMVATSMLKRGASLGIATQVAERTAAILGETATTGTFIAGSHGSAMLDGRQQVMDMDAGWLADNSEYFQNALRQVSADPNNKNLSATEQVNLAKEETANYVSKTIAGDPATIAASIAGAYGDKLLFGAVAGKVASKGILKGAGKGALTEAGTEAIENAGQAYGENTAINDVAGTKRDPWEGAAKNAIEGAAIGALTGAVPGAVGGFRGKENTDSLSDDSAENSQPETQSQPTNDVQSKEVQSEQPYSPNPEPNLDNPAYEREVKPHEPDKGSEIVDPNNMDLPTYLRQQKAINTDLPEITRDDEIKQKREATRKTLSEKGVLKEPLQSQDMVDLARAFNPERAAQIEEELSDPSIDANPEYVNQLEQEYQSLASQALQLDVDPVATSINRRIDSNKKELAGRKPDNLQEALEQAQQQPIAEESEVEQPQKEPSMQSVLDDSIKHDKETSNQLRDHVTDGEGLNDEQVPVKKAVGSDLSNDINQAAQETNTNPSEAQIEAGNYKKGTVKVHGLKVAIENPEGSQRSGTDEDGKPWSVKMNNHYGYVKGTNGADSDSVDVFIEPDPESKKVFVVNQVNPKTGQFDEHKAMVGFDSQKAAEEAYNSNYSKGWKGLGSITETNVDHFKTWLNSGDTSKPFSETNDPGESQATEETKVHAATVRKFTDKAIERLTDPKVTFIGDVWKTKLDELNSIRDELDSNPNLKPEEVKELGNRLTAAQRGEINLSNESVSQDKPSKGMSLKSAQLATSQWLKDYKGGAGIKIKVVQTQAEAESAVGMKFDGSYVHALYNSPEDEVVVVADNISNPKQLRQKLRHEVLVHHGLKAVVGDSEYKNILERVYRSKNSPYLKDIWDGIKRNYSQLGTIDQVEEVLAKAAESDRGKVKQWLDGILEMVARALRKVGLMKTSDVTKAELYNIVKTLGERTQHVNQWADASQNPDPDYVPKLSQTKFSKESRVPADAKVIKGKPIEAGSLKEMRLKAKAKGFEFAGKSYINKDSGIKITVGKKGIKHTVSHSGPDLLSSVSSLTSFLTDSKYLGALPERKGNQEVKAHHYFGIKYQINDSIKDVVVDVRELSNGHYYYDHSFEMERSGSDGDGPGPRLRTLGPIYPSMGAEPDVQKSVATKEDIVKAPDSSSKGDIKFSQTRQMTIDEALAQDSPKERFNGVLNAISHGIKKAMGTKVGGAIRGDIGLGAVTLRQLSDLAKDKLPQLSHYVDTVHRMLTRRNQLAFDAHEMADGIRKWMARNRKDADAMFGIAHSATVDGVDPDLDFKSAEEAILKRYEQILPDKAPRDPKKSIQDMIRHLEKVNEGSHKTNEQMKELKELRNLLKDEPRRKSKHAELKRRFDKLPEDAKKHYRSMRDKYKERHNLYRKLLEQQIESAAIDGKLKKARIADLKSQFELQEVMAPYFPLSRFGDYWISTTDENGEKRFMMYESEGAQQADKKKLESQGYDVLSGYKLDKSPGIEGASLGFITDLMSRVEEAKLNEVKKAELKDTIYQMYLQALPSRSMRKQFMHRQKVKGWSNDALRALAENMVKGSYQLARLEYADELTKLASDATKTAGASGDNQSSRYANELLKRHEWVMNPTHSKVAQKITSLGFLYMLGFSPAAAAINTTQNFVVALPMIGSKFGFGKAGAELTKATKDFIAAKGSIKDKLTDLDEIAAFSHWYDSGLLDSTNAHDLAGMAEGQNWSYNPAYEKFAGWMSGLFNSAEVYNRETTALAAYRLARKDGMNHEEATKYAEDLTWNAHFDYTNVNRARYMQSPFMKVATQFKQYSQNMTYYLMRNAYLSMKGMTKQERSEARKQLIGTLGVTALIGGISALPLSLIYGVANGLDAAFGDDDKPWDAETEFKGYLSDVFGSDVADKMIYGVGGAGISPRISLDGMWLRDPNRDMEGEDTWSFYAQQAAGPVLGGILLQAIKSGDKIADGDYYRGIEGMVPKVFKDAMKAYRYADEGALNNRGNAYLESDDFDSLDIGLQAIGITPGDLSKQYQVNNARKEYEQHVLDRRSNLMKAYYLAWKQHDESLMLETQKAISKFNRKYPKLALTTKKIKQSIKTRTRYNQRSFNGVNLNKNLRNFENEVVW